MLVLLAICRLMVLFFIFMHLHLASHLGTLDAPREGRDVGAKPEDGVGGSIPRMEGPWSACLEWRRRQDGAS